MVIGPWLPPTTRYYYDWYGEGFGTGERSDLEIKQDILDRIRNGPYEDQYDIEVNVRKRVVILTGVSKSSVAKRAAGEDARDTEGVVDVSNQIAVAA